MMDPKYQTRRIATFIGVTYLWSWIFMYQAISAGKITAAAALGGMWSPFVAVLVTRTLFPDGKRRGSLAGLGWSWGETRWQLWSYFLPAFYVGVAHGVAWVLGRAGFPEDPASALASEAAKALALGTVFGSIAALGEEVGWQGYLVPRLYEQAGFTKAALFRGLVWSVWHYPLIAGGVYGTTHTPLWYRLSCFTVTLTAISFAFTWLRIRSGSLWTGVILHAMHNLYIQEIFPSMTVDYPSTKYLVDEFGALSAIASVLVAVGFWMKRRDLPRPASKETADPADAGRRHRG